MTNGGTAGAPWLTGCPVAPEVAVGGAGGLVVAGGGGFVPAGDAWGAALPGLVGVAEPGKPGPGCKSWIEQAVRKRTAVSRARSAGQGWRGGAAGGREVDLERMGPSSLARGAVGAFSYIHLPL